MKLLIIEDEADLAISIQTYLKKQDFVCEWVDNLSEALEKISLYNYDCILLDLGLPDGEGFKVIEEIQRQKKDDGVIIISARETLDVRLKGFELGADDYLTKPFHVSELLMRILALIRRKNFHTNSNIINYCEINIDFISKVVSVNDKEIDLTKKEFILLMFFIGNKGRVLSKSAIAEHLSGDLADMLDNHDFVYAHIKNIKRKLQVAGCNDYIKTIYGLGYKWGED